LFTFVFVTVSFSHKMQRMDVDADGTFPLPRLTIKDASDVNDDHVVFSLHTVDLALANSLRRVFTAEVPTMAIELVKVLRNTSILHDEYLVHRLGLVPLRAAPGAMSHFVFNDVCNCATGYCDHCSVRLTLAVSCDANSNDPNSSSSSSSMNPTGISSSSSSSSATAAGIGANANGTSAAGTASDHRLITARDLISSSEWVKPYLGPDDPGVQLLQLKTGQAVELECVARKGIGKLHAKWQPVCAARFSRAPEVSLVGETVAQLEPEEKEALAASCPVGVYRYEPTTDMLAVEHADRCMFCRECVVRGAAIVAEREARTGQRMRQRTVVQIGERRDWATGVVDVEMHVEGTGSLPVPEVVSTGLDVLKAKIEKIREEFMRAVPRFGSHHM
jgi:DNA-directed RNA polymerase alpha subunit